MKKFILYSMFLVLLSILIFAAAGITSPIHNSVTKLQSITFVANFTAVNTTIEAVANATLYISGGVANELVNTTMGTADSLTNMSSWTVTNLTELNYTWYVIWSVNKFNKSDITQQLAGSNNQTQTNNLYVYRSDAPSVTYSGDASGTEYYSGGMVIDVLTNQFANISFTCSVGTNVHARNCSLWTNQTGTWAINQTHAVSTGQTSWTARMSMRMESNDLKFAWNLYGCSDRGNCSWAISGSDGQSGANKLIINTSLKSADSGPSFNSGAFSPVDGLRVYSSSVVLAGIATDTHLMQNVSLFIGLNGAADSKPANATNTTVSNNTNIIFGFPLTLGNGTYEYWFTAEDGHNLTSTKANSSKRSLIVDLEAPVNVWVRNNSETASCNSWNFTLNTTNEASYFNLTYSLQSGSASTAVFQDLATKHSALATGLLPDTTYVYNITTCDAGQNCATVISGTIVFKQQACAGWSSYAMMVSNLTLTNIVNNSGNLLTSVCLFNNTYGVKGWSCFNVGSAINANQIVKRGEAWYGYTAVSGMIDIDKFGTANTSRMAVPITQGWNLIGETEGRSFYNISWLSMNATATNSTISPAIVVNGVSQQVAFTFYNNSRQGKYITHPFNFTLNNATIVPKGWSWWIYTSANFSWMTHRDCITNMTGIHGWDNETGTACI